MTFWKRRNVVLCFIIFYRRFLLSIVADKLRKSTVEKILPSVGPQARANEIIGINEIRNFIRFTLCCSVIDQEDPCHFLHQSVGCKPETNHDLVTRVFPRFKPFGYSYFEFSLAPCIFLPK